MCEHQVSASVRRLILQIFVSDLTAAIGPIKTGSVQFGEFVVPNQAFSTYGSYHTKPSKHDAYGDALSVDAPGSNATSGGLISGLIGVGP